MPNRPTPTIWTPARSTPARLLTGSLLLGSLVMGLSSASRADAADVLVGRSVPASQRVAVDEIDHSAWDALLGRYVDDDGLVDYRAWNASNDEVAALDGYLGELSRADRDAVASNDARLAYWINAYNAVTVRGILREYPTSSIRNHTAKLWGYNIWKNLKLRVDGGALSLDEIEHEILRPMGDPRIHFAIVCASIGCPRLLNESYTADQLDTQLDTNARDFFSRDQNFRFDASRKRVALSSILSWFGEDFGDNERAVLRRVAQWLPSDAARRVATSPRVRVDYLDYDWNLNAQP